MTSVNDFCLRRPAALTKIKNPKNLEDYKLDQHSVLESFVKVPDEVEDETAAKIPIRGDPTQSSKDSQSSGGDDGQDIRSENESRRFEVVSC